MSTSEEIRQVRGREHKTASGRAHSLFLENRATERVRSLVQDVKSGVAMHHIIPWRAVSGQTRSAARFPAAVILQAFLARPWNQPSASAISWRVDHKSPSLAPSEEECGDHRA